MDIGESILFRHSKAGELCERFPFCIVSKRRDCWGVFNISGMANAFYKGTKVEELDRECRRNAALYDVSRKYTRCSRVVGLARKRGGKFVLLVQDTRLHLVQTEEVLVSLDELKGIVNIDEEKMVAEVWAGTKLYDLGKLLEEKGYAQENLGDIDSQSIAGAISTGTHGTGITFGSLSTQVIEITAVLSNGESIVCSEAENVEYWRAFQLSLGMLGIIVKIKLKVIPAYSLVYESENSHYLL